MENIIDSLLNKEPLPEVGKSRLAEYKAIRPLLREEYHMIWRSPQDLNLEICFD
ncbi:MAG: hypothetical protein J6M55_05745 [Paludibacteraceae bacterium]|nr:hypothetical protein [Paludibacteraceae bacterium]